MLSIDQALTLGRLAEESFVRHGLRVTSDGAGAVSGPDGHFGLHNLATKVAAARWRRWPALVEEHTTSVLAAHAAAEEPIRPGQVLLKLRHVDDLPSTPDFEAASRLPGILALPAVDRPTHVHELLHADRFAHLGDYAAVSAIGLANLRALPAPSVESLRADEARPDSVVHIFIADDFFGASRVLLLDELLASALHVEGAPHGCLVAVPNRHVLAVHILEGVGVVAASRVLMDLGASQCATSPGPISPDVYYLPVRGMGQRVGYVEDDGAARFVVEGRLQEAFVALGLMG